MDSASELTFKRIAITFRQKTEVCTRLSEKKLPGGQHMNNSLLFEYIVNGNSNHTQCKAVECNIFHLSTCGDFFQTPLFYNAKSYEMPYQGRRIQLLCVFVQRKFSERTPVISKKIRDISCPQRYCKKSNFDGKT